MIHVIVNRRMAPDTLDVSATESGHVLVEVPTEQHRLATYLKLDNALDLDAASFDDVMTVLGEKP